MVRACCGPERLRSAVPWCSALCSGGLGRFGWRRVCDGQQRVSQQHSQNILDGPVVGPQLVGGPSHEPLPFVVEAASDVSFAQRIDFEWLEPFGFPPQLFCGSGDSFGGFDALLDVLAELRQL